MPEESYLDAKTLPAEELALQISEIVKDKDKYLKYFRWQKYYAFENPQDSPDTDEYCALCAMMNNERRRSERKVYAYFSQWWNEYPYGTDEILASLYPAPIVTFSPAKRNDRKIIIENPQVLTSRYADKKNEESFFGYIVNLVN